MKLSLFHKLFKNEISIAIFKGMIQSEVEEYSKKLKTKGTSLTINVDEDCSLYFSKNDFLKLCEYYLNNKLTDSEVYYIADCLTLTESVSFEGQELLELLEGMTDPESNGIITKERILSIIDTFK
ncbi:MAG TPA: hypothetical protein VIY47_05925 [Ignavibacteriaceae bacterium]